MGLAQMQLLLLMHPLPFVLPMISLLVEVLRLISPPQELVWASVEEEKQ